MRAECYIGFQKLLNEELKMFDMKDSIILHRKLSVSGNNNNNASQILQTQNCA